MKTQHHHKFKKQNFLSIYYLCRGWYTMIMSEWKLFSHVWLFAMPWTVQSLGIRPESGVGSLSLLQGIFPTQGSNPSLSHCRWILYQLSHKGSPIMGKGLLNNYPRNKKRQQGAKLKARREKGHLPLLVHIQLLKNKTKQKNQSSKQCTDKALPSALWGPPLKTWKRKLKL